MSIAHRPDTASSFVTFSTREDAEEAQREMDGFPILEKQLKVKNIFFFFFFFFFLWLLEDWLGSRSRYA